MAVDSGLLRRGIYKTVAPEGMEDYAQVEDVNGGSSMPLDESLYRDRGYEPPFETLPLYDDWVANRIKAKPDA